MSPSDLKIKVHTCPNASPCCKHLQVRICLPSQGNVILTDGNYEIMTLLRSHRDDAKGLQIMARHPYPLHSIRLRQPVTPEQLAAVLDAPEALMLRGESCARCCAVSGGGLRAVLRLATVTQFTRSIIPRGY
jgi:hypothetical protein